MSTSSTAQTPAAELRAVQAATAVGRALGRTATFRKYEVAQETFMNTAGLRDRLEAYQRRQQDLQNARAWGGADPTAEQQLDAEWERLSRMPEIQGYMEAQQELIELCGQVVNRISAGVGIDFGRACAPAGGCC